MQPVCIAKSKSTPPCGEVLFCAVRARDREIYGIICPVSECEPQAKHEFSGIDTMFLNEYERYAKCELRNMV